MKKTKICFLSSYAYPLFNKESTVTHGGAEVELYYFGASLAKDTNYEVSFIVGDFGQEKVEEFENVKLYKALSPKTKESPFTKLKQAFVYNQLMVDINADIYFTATRNALAGLVAMHCKRNGKKHLHRTEHQNEVDLTSRKYGVVGKAFIYGLENANLVITQNESHKQLLRQNHNINAHIIRNAHIIPEPNTEKRSHILWIARCESWKNPDLYLELAKRLPQFKFVMIAPYSENYHELFYQIEKQAETVKNLEFIPKVAYSDIQSYYDRALAFVNTSDNEGFPNTFIESAKGKTPIASYIVNPDSFLTEHNCGICGEGNLNLFTQDLKDMIGDKDIWKTKSDNIYKYVKEYHDVDNNTKRLKELIDQYLMV